MKCAWERTADGVRCTRRGCRNHQRSLRVSREYPLARIHATCWASAEEIRTHGRYWKSPPLDPDKLWLANSIEMQILLACNWSCHACNQLSNFHGISFIKKGTMTLAQVRFFVGEMHKHNAYFGRIRILGGEPTIHPKFTEIVKLLHEELVVKGHVGFLEVITNGDHLERVKPVQHLFSRVRVSREKAKQTRHIANLLQTPKSLGYRGIRCNTPEHCGWSLSYYGWAPCSPAASIMRMWDMADEHQRMTIPIESPKPGVPPTEANWPRLQEFCDLCQHGLKPEDMVKCGTGTKPGQHELNTPEPETWSHLAPWLNGKQADFKVYGRDS